MLKELKEKKGAAVAKMGSILEAAKADGNRDLTEAEAKEFDELEADVAALDKQIARAERFETHQASVEQVQPAASRSAGIQSLPRAGGDPAKKEFENLGEFIHAVRFNKNDARLSYVEPHNVRGEQRMDTGSSGGFMVPAQFIPTLKQVDAQGSVIRPRATVIGAGDPPDAPVTMPALDQSTTNLYGGVDVQWIGEGAEKPDTDAKFKEITLTPQEVAGLVTVTDKLLRNWGAASGVIEKLLRGATIAAEEKAFFKGDGVAKPLGLLNSNALMKVNRAVSNQVAYADIANMFGNFYDPQGNGVFMYNPRILPTLMKLKDEDGRLVWQNSAREGAPDSLFGLPAIKNYHSPALGSLGDLVLADWGNYLIKDGSGPLVSASEHVKFTSNKTVIKITWNVDGQPWLNAPLKLEDGLTASPFIALDVPA